MNISRQNVQSPAENRLDQLVEAIDGDVFERRPEELQAHYEIQRRRMLVPCGGGHRVIRKWPAA